MNVLLIAPPFNTTQNKSLETYPPLGILMLSSFLKGKGIKTNLLDLSNCNYKLSTPVKETLLSFKPDIVGISSIIASYEGTIKVAKLVKKFNKNIKVVIGGIYPTFGDKEILSIHKEIDFIVRGEGEITLYNLVNALSKKSDVNKIKGISFMKNNVFIRNPDQPLISNLSLLDLPDYKALKSLPRYKKKGKMLIVSSRGCVYKCSFCSTSNYWKHTWRCFNAERTFQEIKYLVNVLGAKEILMGDDLFIVDQKRVVEICKKVVKENLKFKWRCSVRANMLTDDIAKWLKKAGCDSVFMGIESGDPYTLKKMDKMQTLKQIRKSISICHKEGIQVVGSFIIGLPWEDKRSIRKTINFAKSLKIDQAIWFLYHPDLGSPMYKQLQSYNINILDTDPDHCINTGRAFIQNTLLSSRELEELYLEAVLSTNN